jgi:hypothetical protein
MAGKPLLELSHDLEAAAVGQQEVQQDDIRAICGHAPVTGLAGGSDCHPKAVVLELNSVHVRDRGIVLDQEHMNTFLAAGLRIAAELYPASGQGIARASMKIWEPKGGTRLEKRRRHG